MGLVLGTVFVRLNSLRAVRYVFQVTFHYPPYMLQIINIFTYIDGGKHDVRSLLCRISMKINITNNVIAEDLCVLIR